MPAAGFTFGKTHWHQLGDDLELSLHYALSFAGEQHTLCERMVFPEVALPDASERQQALAAAVQLLHWLAGCSYWKTTCSRVVDFEQTAPDRWQAQALAQVYRHGLAEFGFVNGLDTGAWTGLFEHNSSDAGVDRPAAAPALHPRSRALVPMGGGKDSLVALELLQQAGFDCTVSAVRPAALITTVAQATACAWLPIQRHIDSKLLHLNTQGALNGHVPITAINAAVLLVAAILYDFEAVVFANEASADEPTRYLADGTPVNHQYSKSSAFEVLLQEWIKRYIASDLACFSLLRPLSELAICQQFSRMPRYHQVFSSCNRQFHLEGARSQHRWCGQCPKCLFVYLALAPFMSPKDLHAIFAADLLDDASLVAGFADLCGLGDKPFECVGTKAEARAALLALVNDPDRKQQWSDMAVPQQLAGTARALTGDPLSSLLAQRHRHHIPVAYQRALPQ
jgi:UDP-N-acetyl-alpha-D-muramoyl-L-alanyl-L-glutamate epimerase